MLWLKIDKNQVKHLAKLAKLRVNETKAESLTQQMDKLIEFADTLSELNTDDVEPTMHAIFVSNVFREDIVKPSLSKDEVLRCSPEHDEQFIIVPSIIE